MGADNRPTARNRTKAAGRNPVLAGAATAIQQAGGKITKVEPTTDGKRVTFCPAEGPGTRLTVTVQEGEPIKPGEIRRKLRAAGATNAGYGSGK